MNDIVFNDIKTASLSANIRDLPSAQGESVEKTLLHARVLDFHGGKALLQVEGRTVIAESDVPLKLNSEFDIVIRGQTEDGKVSLRIVGAEEAETSVVRPMTDRMISSRLIGFDLPEHESSVPAARSLLRNGVPVTKSNMESMLQALPQKAGPQTIEFAASLLKEGLPLSREIINLIPRMERELEALPANLKAVAEASGQARNAATVPETADEASGQAKAGSPGGQGEAATARGGNGAPAEMAAPPQGDDRAALLARLPTFIRAFLHSAEAHLKAVSETNVAINAAGAERAELVERLVSILKVMPETPPPDPQPVDNAARNLLRQVSGMKIEDAALERVRAAFVQEMERALEISDAGRRFEAIRGAALKAIRAAVESPPPAQPAQQADTAQLFSRIAAILQENALDSVQKFESLLQAFQGGERPGGATTNDILTLLSSSARLQALQVDENLQPHLKEFVELAGRWARSAAEAMQQQVQAPAEKPEGELAARLAADTVSRELLERINLLARDPELRQEVENLIRNMQGPPDLRSALARMADAAGNTQDLAANLTRGLQFANLANLAQHSGTGPMDSFVTFFPIQMGDRVEIGKLKVYRKSEDRQGRETVKQLDPFDARLVLVLNTEFLGLSMVTFQTYADKGIQCDFEVQDRRRKKIVEKFLDELEEALRGTVYERSRLSVRVRRRKSADKGDTGTEDSGAALSIDLRI